MVGIDAAWLALGAPAETMLRCVLFVLSLCFLYMLFNYHFQKNSTACLNIRGWLLSHSCPLPAWLTEAYCCGPGARQLLDAAHASTLLLYFAQSCM